MLEGLYGMLSPQMMLTLALSTFGGVVVGGLPGLTATMAVALLVPFTFTLGPAVGLVAIGGLYVGAMYGGAIPACLVNTPGTPSALATTFDGFPLTRRGKGQHALVAAGISSAAGAFIGGLTLLLLSPPLAEFSLRFGPPEFFWVGIFGLTMIASLASGSLWKGLAGGALGMLLSTIGVAPALAHARYTFGVPALLGGLSMVATLVGLFAVPQALRLVESHVERPRIAAYRETKGVFSEVARELLSRPVTLLRSSVIGSIVGILPAAGSPIAALISYNEAVRWSRDPDGFGKGTVEGVAASEAAGNAAAPASMIPLLALGVPGSPPAAVALGALLLHGLRPGQALYAEHADVVYTFIWSMILAGFVIMLVSSMLSRFLVRIAAFPVHVLAPMILVLAVVGSFAIRNNELDVAITLSFGLLGYALDKLGFSAGPIVLGLILGPIVESGLVSTLAMVGTGRSWPEVFLLRPISGVLILFTLLSLAWPLVSTRFLSLRKGANDSPGGESMRGERARPRAHGLNTDLVGGGLLIALAAVALVYAREATFNVWIFPRITAAALALLGAGLVVKGCIAPDRRELFSDWSQALRVFPFALGLIAYGVLFSRAGFVATTIVAYAAATWVLRRRFTPRSAAISLVIGAVVTLVLHQLFTQVFYVPLPRGDWWSGG